MIGLRARLIHLIRLVTLSLSVFSLAGISPGSVTVVAAPAAPTATITVTSSADSGAGTLRQALLDATSGDTIDFDTSAFPPGSPVTITLSSGLPTITVDNLTVDGSAAGVILDGGGTASGTDGLIIDGASNVAVKGLWIVNFPSAGVILRNGTTYATIGGANATPGGTCSGDCNVISGNREAGVNLTGSGTTSNTVSGNYIGVDPTGSQAWGNGVVQGAGTYGILIDASSGNTIGGIGVGEGNVISGNGDLFCGPPPQFRAQGGGIAIRNDADDNVVQGNKIGTNADGSAAIPNAEDGIVLSDVTGTLVGGAVAGAGNLISGNSCDGPPPPRAGVALFADGNTVQGNKIGTDATGTAALPNAWAGVWIGGGENDNAILDNLISGNASEGIYVGGSNNTIAGNLIGTDVTGTTALANGATGIVIQNEANGNTVGGTNASPGDVCSGDCNLISGNAQYGVSLEASASTPLSNTISGNYVGTTISGTAAIPNADSGIRVSGGTRLTTIGGDSAGERNLISGNGVNGVLIEGAATMTNTVSGNYIGVDVSGAAGLGNGTGSGGYGVIIGDWSGWNIVGGTAAGEGNIISGNGDLFCGPPDQAHAIGGGVTIRDGAHNNGVQGNVIGLNASGTAPIPNAMSGVDIDGGTDNVIGGDAAGAGNLISGNSCDGPPPPRAGIRLSGTRNTIQGNTIGPDISGTTVFTTYTNGWTGIWVIGPDNAITENLIRGNGGDQGAGISIDGVQAQRNGISQNAIYDHGGKGIYLTSGANGWLFPPIMSDVGPMSVGGLAVPGATVEVYSDDGDEGRWYQGSTTVDADGHFTFTSPLPFTGTHVTATASEPNGNTSEFASSLQPTRDVILAAIYVPQSRHQVGLPITPTVRVGNAGTAPETITVTAVITQGTSRIYERQQVVAPLGALYYKMLSFPSWTPSTTGQYVFGAWAVASTPDTEPGNDAQTWSFAVADDRVDLWAKDDVTDDGSEPSLGSAWQSADVWVRNTTDGRTTPQDPINNITNTVYIRVRNRGTLASPSAQATVYWHPPALVIAQPWWSPIGTINVGTLAPGAVATATLAWRPQVSDVLTEPYHTCLVEVISSTLDPAPVTWDVRGSNNVAQRNVDVIEQAAPATGLRALATDASSTFHVGNPYSSDQLVDVIFDTSGISPTAQIGLVLGDLFDRWGELGLGDVTHGAVVPATKRITFNGGGQTVVSGIPLASWELVSVGIEVTGLSNTPARLDISERIGGDVLGGLTLEIAPPHFEVYIPLVLRQ